MFDLMESSIREARIGVLREDLGRTEISNQVRYTGHHVMHAIDVTQGTGRGFSIDEGKQRQDDCKGGIAVERAGTNGVRTAGEGTLRKTRQGSHSGGQGAIEPQGCKDTASLLRPHWSAPGISGVVLRLPMNS